MVNMPDRETKLKDAIHTLKAAIAAVAEEYGLIDKVLEKKPEEKKS